MGQPGRPDDAVLFIAVIFQKQLPFKNIEQIAIDPFGEIFCMSPCFDFVHSAYYAPEMGRDLSKVFVVYKGLYSIDLAIKTKLDTIAIEKVNAISGKRTVNIDPGYLTLAKLVLTTTKNFDHRIHIGNGIFADIQLRYRGGNFVENPWTYPDYRETLTLEFLAKARAYLHKLVKAG